jgi:hypothetical protein
MNDGSGFCFTHNPNLAEERNAMYQKNGQGFKLLVRPPQRVCKIKGCQGWTMEDGEGLCHSHKPEEITKKRIFMKGNKYRVGSHMPWLNLKDIKEARGLLWYSLETKQPLLTLRALTKIASLHARGEMGIPSKPALEQTGFKDTDEAGVEPGSREEFFKEIAREYLAGFD